MNPEPAVLRSGRFEPGVTIHFHVDRVVHVVVDEGVVLDLETSKAIRDRIAEITDGPYVVVGDLSRIAFIDRGARAELAGDHDGRLLATATIVGKDGVLPFLAHRWIADNIIERPVAFFEDTPEALAWAHGKAAEFRKAGRLP